MPASFINVCAGLDQLCREHGVEPPEMTLSFAAHMDRARFGQALKQELSWLSTFPVTEARIDSCHGIKFHLGVKR